MTQDKDQRLRKRAEVLYRERKKGAAQIPIQVDDLLHDLEVHQIELQMQNEELRRAQQLLEVALQRYAGLFDLAPVGYLTLGASGEISNANLMAANLLGVNRASLSGSNFNRFVSYDHKDGLLLHLRATFRGGNQVSELKLVNPDGKSILVQMESVVEQVGDDREVTCLTVLKDITERRRQEELIYRQANYDTLTGLPNRGLFKDRLNFSIQTAQRDRDALALFYVDIDNFKLVNDTYGHATGDALLKEVAQRLTGFARANDTVARLSGDEFCIILPKMFGDKAASRFATKMLDAADKPFDLPNAQNLRVTFSIGIAFYPRDGDSPEALLKSADIALYQVKRTGRSRFAIYTEKANENILRQQQLSFELENAIEKNQLTLRYQPIVSLDTGRMFGVEALVRWQHPKYGLVQPVDFIPLAETNGMIADLDDWVLSHTAEWMRRWREEGRVLDITWVNLSSKHCANPDWVRRLTARLELLNKGQDLPHLGLEVTESRELELTDEVVRAFERLHQLGYSLSVDDFGTGHSSLERLLLLPINIIKIDKAFIKNIAISDKSARLVRAVIALGHSMEAHLVAEGIETAEQQAILRGLGCDYGQGFHISVPLTSDELVEFLQTREGPD